MRRFMGLGIQMHAEGGRRGLLGRRPAPERLRDELAEALVRLAVRAAPALAGFARVASDGDQRLVRLHPADEEVRVSVDAGEVQLSARTNGGGPGYHAFVVRLMDQVASDLGLRWRSDGDDDDLDETGFFAARDFSALQQEMAGWLGQIARMVTAGEAGEGPWLLSMPLDTPMPAEDFRGALAPMGCFDRSWLEQTGAASGPELRARAAQYFPWWEEPVAAGLPGVGRCLLQQLAWHPPATEDERVQLEVALACLGPASASPELAMELVELRELLRRSPEQARVPAPARFGFRRGLVRHHPFPGVGLTLPGYFYEHDEDNGIHCYWFGERTVRVSSLKVTPPPGTPLSSAPPLNCTSRPGAIEAFDLSLAPPAEGHCTVIRGREEGEDYLQAQATLVRPGRAVVVTVTFTDPADVAWTKSLLATFQLAPADDE
jgi:hypothetical protein